MQYTRISLSLGQSGALRNIDVVETYAQLKKAMLDATPIAEVTEATSGRKLLIAKALVYSIEDIRHGETEVVAAPVVEESPESVEPEAK